MRLSVRYKEAWPFVGLLILAVLGYWPISSGIFALKNDDFIYFLPYRYNISEIIRSGHLPLWSPYIYMGFPVAGDMQSGAWNPLVWLISLTGKYDMTRLSVEILVYLFLAGLGMYKLNRTMSFSKLISFTTGASFMFCGFMLDSGQIMCWVACASVLPWTWMYFIRLIKDPGAGIAVRFSLANLFLIVAGYPAFFIMNAYFLLLIALILFIRLIFKKDYAALKKPFVFLLLSGVLFLFTGMITWLSFAEMLPFYSRGMGVPLNEALEHSYRFKYGLTAFVPFALTWGGPPFPADSGIFRNIYFGVLLIPFALTGAIFKRTLVSNLTIVVILLAFGFSLGTELPLRTFGFTYLPLFSSFRHPANFRVLLIIGILLLSAKGLTQLSGIKGREKLVLLETFTVMISVLMGLAIMSAIDAYSTESLDGPIVAQLKAGKLLNHSLLANILVQLVFIFMGYYAIVKNRNRLFLTLAIGNIIIFAWPQIFYSMVSKESPAAINRFIRTLPSGFPKNINDKQIGHFTSDAEIINYGSYSGIGSFYMKRPVINNSINNPTILTNYYGFLKDTNLLRELREYPVVFFGDSLSKNRVETIVTRKDNSSRINLLAFGPDEIIFSATSTRAGIISIFQNNYPGWKASIDGNPTEILTVNHSFMGINAAGGAHLYRLKYSPWWLIPGAISSIVAIIVCAWLLFRKK